MSSRTFLVELATDDVATVQQLAFEVAEEDLSLFTVADLKEEALNAWGLVIEDSDSMEYELRDDDNRALANDSIVSYAIPEGRISIDGSTWNGPILYLTYAPFDDLISDPTSFPNNESHSNESSSPQPSPPSRPSTHRHRNTEDPAIALTSILRKLKEASVYRDAPTTVLSSFVSVPEAIALSSPSSQPSNSGANNSHGKSSAKKRRKSKKKRLSSDSAISNEYTVEVSSPVSEEPVADPVVVTDALPPAVVSAAIEEATSPSVIPIVNESAATQEDTTLPSIPIVNTSVFDSNMVIPALLDPAFDRCQEIVVGELQSLRQSIYSDVLTKQKCDRYFVGCIFIYRIFYSYCLHCLRNGLNHWYHYRLCCSRDRDAFFVIMERFRQRYSLHCIEYAWGIWRSVISLSRLMQNLDIVCLGAINRGNKKLCSSVFRGWYKLLISNRSRRRHVVNLLLQWRRETLLKGWLRFCRSIKSLQSQNYQRKCHRLEYEMVAMRTQMRLLRDAIADYQVSKDNDSALQKGFEDIQHRLTQYKEDSHSLRSPLEMPTVISASVSPDVGRSNGNKKQGRRRHWNQS